MARNKALVLAFRVLGLALRMSAADPPAQAVQVTTTERVEFAPGGTIRLNDSYGSLTLEGWDRPEVEITVTKLMPHDSKGQPDEAKKRLDEIRVGTERKSGSELVISTSLPAHRSLVSPFVPRKTAGDVTIEYQIHAPRDSKLAIHHGTGSVVVSQMTGDTEATCGQCDMVLMLRDSGAYAIDAKSKLGTVTSDFDGRPRVRR